MKSSETEAIIFPEGAHFYSHQIAGHEYDGKSKLGVLQYKNGTIIKPLKENDRKAERELQFYLDVFDKEQSDPILNELREFIPIFRGTTKLKIGDIETKFLCLEDVCESFEKPSILDIKIGKKTYDPEASAEKIAYEISKHKNAESLGFRILGMKIYNDQTGDYIKKDKKYGKQIVMEEMKSVLELMLLQNSFINCLMLCGFLHKLTKIANWFKKQRKYEFISSSLLFVYEGRLSSWFKWVANDDDDELDSTLCSNCSLPKNLCHFVKTKCKLIRLELIDFAHVFPSQEEDVNYIPGLENLTKYIQSMLNDQKKISFCT